jgi:hypothetical protein
MLGSDEIAEHREQQRSVPFVSMLRALKSQRCQLLLCTIALTSMLVVNVTQSSQAAAIPVASLAAAPKMQRWSSSVDPDFSRARVELLLQIRGAKKRMTKLLPAKIRVRREAMAQSFESTDGPVSVTKSFVETVPMSVPLPRYDAKKFPTRPMPPSGGPIGYWKRLPIPQISLMPDGPKAWWPVKEDGLYLNHNILMETIEADFPFNRAAIETTSMNKWMNKITNKMRREAIMQCAVALEEFMRSHFPHAQWWLEGGSLVGALRKPHQFIPWDSDADVTMTEDSWHQIVSMLKEQHQETAPNAEGAACGCLLLDTASFGSRRQGFDGRNQIPGRVVNECTGNYVDIFNTFEHDGRLVLSQQSKDHPGAWSWPESVVLPPQKCAFDGYVFNCPADPAKYLEAYPYGANKGWAKPDHSWDKKKHIYVDSQMPGTQLKTEAPWPALDLLT